ncbi:ATP-binding protein [Thermoactinospora rubra]|uniref:ATP-binding protein n=1 Tax=Thermoactinospora rubra TaxID=1088767 RepID=UPI001F0A4F82|nr:ATP-binding protein [Thermoactinospora rubra]
MLCDTDPEGHLAVFERPVPVSVARMFVATALREWEVPEAICDTQLVVSELVTNAIRHGGGALSLALVVRGGHVACAVSDPGGDPPAAVDADCFAEYGRGLHLVQALSLCWGWYPTTGGGKRVWAVLR